MFSNAKRFVGICVIATTATCLPCLATDPACDGDDLDSSRITVEFLAGKSISDLTAPPEFTIVDAIPGYRLWLLEVQAEVDVEFVADLLENDPVVNRAEVLGLLETPEGVQRSIPDLGIAFDLNDYVGQTALTQVNAGPARQNYGGAGITVAVLDTGFALQHPMLVDRLLAPGLDAIDGTGSASAKPNGVDDDGDGDVDESLHHGTFVAGLIAVIAPEAKILPIRVLEADGKGSTFSVARGILHATQQGADIINLSIGMGGESRAIKIALEDAADRGVLVIAAAGNRNSTCVDFPANQSTTVGVASVDTVFSKTIFSSFGESVDLTAPGLDLLSTFADSEFARWSGTSFAAPLVSAGAALLLDRYPNLTPDEVRAFLRQTAQPDNDPPLAGLLGAGVLDLESLTRVMAADRTTLELSRSLAGTVLHWSPVRGASSYDVARGGLGSLRPESGDVALGPLVCLANDTMASETPSAIDAELPARGEAFFYLFRDDAIDDGGYGKAASGESRIAGDLDCPIESPI